MLTDVSVVIPTYNSERFIADALSSVASQTLKPCEVIIVDDGSTDATIDVVESWSRSNRNPPVKLVEADHQGPSHARNLGIRLARSSYIALLDSDDRYLPCHVSTLMEAMHSKMRPVVVFGDASGFSDSGIVKASYIRGRVDPASYPHADISGWRIFNDAFEQLAHGSFIATCSSLICRRSALDVGLFNEKLWRGGDGDLFLRLSKAGPFLFTEKMVASVRFHDNNITHPRNAALSAFYFFVYLDQIYRKRDEYRLTKSEVLALKQSLRKRSSDYLYYASLNGLGTLTEALRRCAPYQRLMSLQSAKHIARALVQSAGNVSRLPSSLHLD